MGYATFGARRLVVVRGWARMVGACKMCLEGLLIYDLSQEFCSSTTVRLVRLLGNLLHYVYHICYAQTSRESEAVC